MLEELTQATLAPAFYKDNEKAQAVLRRRAQAEQKLDLARKLGKDIEDASDYLELGAAENDEGAIADAAAPSSR